MICVVLLARPGCHSSTLGLFMDVSVRHCLHKNQLLIFVEEFLLTTGFVLTVLSQCAAKPNSNHQFVGEKSRNVCLPFLTQMLRCKLKEEWKGVAGALPAC